MFLTNLDLFFNKLCFSVNKNENYKKITRIVFCLPTVLDIPIPELVLISFPLVFQQSYGSPENHSIWFENNTVHHIVQTNKPAPQFKVITLSLGRYISHPNL